MPSKTDIVFRYKPCPKHYLVYKQMHGQYKENESVDREFRSKQGDAVEEIAKRRFNDWETGTTIALVDQERFSEISETQDQEAAMDWAHKDAFERTAIAIARGDQIIYQAAAYAEFDDGSIYGNADILRKNPETGKWDMFEVKSSSKKKPEHATDVAFQKIAFEESDIPIGEVYLLHVNPRYVRNGAIDPMKMFIEERMNPEIEEIRQETRSTISGALECEATADHTEYNSCNNPKNCPCPEICHPDLPSEDSIHDIPYIHQSKKKLAALKEAGIQSIHDIDLHDPLMKSLKFSEAQRNYIELIQSGIVDFDPEAIREQLEPVEYPVYFLDFETINPAVPLDGYSPNEQIVFQVGIYVIEKEGATPKKHNIQAKNVNELGAPLLAQLHEVFTNEKGEFQTGKIYVWNKDFELRRFGDLMRHNSKYTGLIEKIVHQITDLADVVSTKTLKIKRIDEKGKKKVDTTHIKAPYRDPKFKNRTSIKPVLGELCPELSYEDENLAINIGTQTSVAEYKILLASLPEEDREILLTFFEEISDTKEQEKIFKDQEEYCVGRDVYGMVKEWEFFRALIDPELVDDRELHLDNPLLVKFVAKMKAQMITADSKEDKDVRRQHLAGQIEVYRKSQRKEDIEALKDILERL